MRDKPTPAEIKGAFSLGQTEALLRYPRNPGALTGNRREAYELGCGRGEHFLTATTCREKTDA